MKYPPKKVTVRKKRSYVYGVRFISAIFAAVTLILFLILRENVLYAALLCAVFDVPMLVLWLYYETWKMVFTESAIHRKIFFIEKIYSYSDVKYAASAYSHTIRYYLKIFLKDGKSVLVPMDDENAEQAKKLLRKYVTVRIIK
jgi:hypothetical protein